MKQTTTRKTKIPKISMYSKHRQAWKIKVDKDTGHRERVPNGYVDHYAEIQEHKNSTEIKDKIVIEGSKVYMPQAILESDKGVYVDETIAPKNAYEAKQMAQKHKETLEWKANAENKVLTDKQVKKAMKEAKAKEKALTKKIKEENSNND